jgi:hypothetical protein
MAEIDNTKSRLLTPMIFQYLVGLCCLRRNPDAVDVTIGDAVGDVAAGIQRDVDITVTLVEPDGPIRAFKGYEVKREKGPLDVTEVGGRAAVHEVQGYARRHPSIARKHCQQCATFRTLIEAEPRIIRSCGYPGFRRTSGGRRRDGGPTRQLVRAPRSDRGSSWAQRLSRHCYRELQGPRSVETPSSH